MKLSTINRESTTLVEYVIRAEAWASTESKPPTYKEIAIVAARTDRMEFIAFKMNFKARVKHVMALLEAARRKRTGDRDTTMNSIKKGLK